MFSVAHRRSWCEGMEMAGRDRKAEAESEQVSS